MSTDAFIALMNQHAPPALQKLRGRVQRFDADSETLELRLDINESFCHSGHIIQGGFIAGMLDEAMAHVVFMHLQAFAVVATLEIKVNFFEIARPGEIIAYGRVAKLGKSIGFLEAELTDAGGVLLANATSTARIIRKNLRH